MDALEYWLMNGSPTGPKAILGFARESAGESGDQPLTTIDALEHFREGALDELAKLARPHPACFGVEVDLESLPFTARRDLRGLFVSWDDFERVLPTSHLRSLWLALAKAPADISILPPTGGLALLKAAALDEDAAEELAESLGPTLTFEVREEDFTDAELESLRQTRPDLFDEERGDDRPAANAPAASALRRAVACGPSAGLRTPHELDLFYEAAFDELHALSSQPPACFGFQYRIDGDGDHVSEADFERVLPTPHLRSLWLAIANERSEIADLPARGRLAFTAAARDARAARELSEDYLEGDCEVFGTEYEEDDFTEEELAELREERPELFDGPAATGVEGIAPGREPSIPERNGGAR